MQNLVHLHLIAEAWRENKVCTSFTCRHGRTSRCETSIVGQKRAVNVQGDCAVCVPFGAHHLIVGEKQEQLGACLCHTQLFPDFGA